MFGAWHLVSTYQVEVFVLKTSQGPSPASALEIYAWEALSVSLRGFVIIIQGESFPIFPLIFPTPKTSPGVCRHTHTHTHTHTGADFLDVQSSNTSCHSCGSGPQSLRPTLSPPGLGLGIPHSLLYAQALRF